MICDGERCGPVHALRQRVRVAPAPARYTPCGPCASRRCAALSLALLLWIGWVLGAHALVQSVLVPLFSGAGAGGGAGEAGGGASAGSGADAGSATGTIDVST